MNWIERLRAGVGIQSLSRTMEACRQTHLEAASTWASRHAFGTEKHWIQPPNIWFAVSKQSVGAWISVTLLIHSRWKPNVWLRCWRLSTLSLIYSDGRHQNVPKHPWVTECVSKIATWLHCLFCFEKNFFQKQLQQVNEQIFLDCNLDDLK